MIWGKQMSYLALYRKYRPSSFDKVKGQDHIVRTLKNQLSSGRVGHAYLFCGTRGTGKTSIAKLFAKAVNCESPVDGSPCGQCAVCRAIDAGNSTNVIEIDAASNNGVDNIRDIVDEVRYSPTEGKYKVYIIDEVHMLSTGAFNALLKTLEEPPSYVIFILATTEVHKLPITILSRCQRYDFKRIPVDTIAECLSDLIRSEGLLADERAVRYIAKTADGSMRDAQSLLDQCIAFSLGQKLEYEKVLDILGSVDIEVFAILLRHITDGSVDGALGILEELVLQGREMGRFVTDFAWYLRNLLVAKTTDHPEKVLEFSAERMEMLLHEAEVMEEERIIRYIRVLSDLSNQIRYASQKRLLVEIALIKLCKPQMETDVSSLLGRIEALEKQLESGVVAAPAASAAVREEGAAENSVGAGQKPAAKVLAPAVSDDIKMIVGRWAEISGRVTSPLKTILTSAYPGYESETVLAIVCKTQMDADMLGRDKHKETLKNALADMTGKQVEFVIKTDNGGMGEESKTLNLTDVFGDLLSYSE